MARYLNYSEWLEDTENVLRCRGNSLCWRFYGGDGDSVEFWGDSFESLISYIAAKLMQSRRFLQGVEDDSGRRCFDPDRCRVITIIRLGDLRNNPEVIVSYDLPQDVTRRTVVSLSYQRCHGRNGPISFFQAKSGGEMGLET
jgi:hypothetical protein